MANDNELRKLNRRELLEILLEQEKELTRLRAELAEARASLLDRTVKTERAGTLAEAVFTLNGVYEDVEKAAAQYLENVRRRDAESAATLEDAKKKSEGLIEDATKKSDALIEDAKKQADAILEDARKQAGAIIKDAEDKRQSKLNETYQYLRTVEQKVNEFYSAHPEAVGNASPKDLAGEECDTV